MSIHSQEYRDYLKLTDTKEKAYFSLLCSRLSSSDENWETFWLNLARTNISLLLIEPYPGIWKMSYQELKRLLDGM